MSNAWWDEEEASAAEHRARHADPLARRRPVTPPTVDEDHRARGDPSPELNVGSEDLQALRLILDEAEHAIGAPLMTDDDAQAIEDAAERVRGFLSALEASNAPTGLEARIERSVAWYRDGSRCPACGEEATKAVNWCVACEWRPMSYHLLEGHGRAELVDDPDLSGRIWRLVEPEEPAP